jgi:NADPH:quinone reductase-like Zn-dependent oxidoreductase
MFSVRAIAASPDDPLSALAVGDAEPPAAPDGWVPVTIRAATLNHHDVFSLRGIGLPAERLPMILGCDGAGVDDQGNELVIYPVIADASAGGGDETLDPRRSLLSEVYPGTFAETVYVPRANVLPKPQGLSLAEAACLPTAWLTAYRMLFTKAQLKPGQSVLVQGAGGGVATAAIVLARASGATVYATSRDQAKRERAVTAGAHAAFEPGERLPERVDAVIETVGQATWSSSLKALRPGGVLVVSGSTSGPNPPADLQRVFFLQLSVLGSTMGTRAELGALMRFLAATGTRPIIDSSLPMAEAATGFRRMIDGDVFGKIVFTL